MIRLEIYSNVAGGEKGIRDYPVLPDLVDTLKAQNLEAGFVNQSFRTESEINLASGKVAQGVRVRGKAERKVQPETHIRGCLAWMRSVLARPERMLHLHIAQTRGTNGAALILGQLYARNHQVFLSGLDASGWRRMLARIDLTGKALPPEIEKDPDLLNEYVARSSRVTSFIAAVSRISDLEMLDPAWQGELTALVSSRDAGLLKKWSRARVVNLGLLNDYLERYDKLIEQFCELMASEEQQSDLPQLFELLVQQAGFPQLLKVLETFVIEEHRGKQKDPRALINAVRIGLNQSKENRRDEFRRVLARLVLSLRVSLDPPLYARGLKLPDYDNDAVDALTPVREGFLQWDQLFRAALAKAGPQSDAKVPANPVVVQALYEMGVNLIFQARISQNFSGGQQPAEVTLARDLLRILPFKPDDLNRIGAMHNKMPPRGVAQNMLKKQPLRQGDVNSIRHNLWKRLYPLGKAAFEISKYLHVQLKDQQSREETARQQAFLKGSHVLVPDSNYVLGEEGRDPLLRVATLAGGRAMGLVVLSSRDEIRNPKALDRLRAPEAAHADGYQMLMHHGGSTWFPSRVMPDHIARAYGHMVHRRVANLTRRFIANRLNHLFATHGTELFGVIYDYLAFRQGLYLSPAQAAAVLVAEKVFEPARLRESGFDPQDPGAGNRENSWLAAGENAGDGASSVAGLNLSRDWKEAGEAFMKSCQSARGAAKPSGGGKAPDGSPVSLADTLAGLAAEQIYDLHSSRAGKALESCQESASLSGLLEELLAANPDLLARPSGSADREAGREGEFTLFGELAYLALLRESHALEISAHREGGEAGTDSGAEKVQVRLLPGRFRKPGARDKASARLCGLLGQALKSHPSGRALGVAAGKLKSWDENWIRATQVASVVLTEHALRETVLRMVKPSPPRLEELRALDDRKILCLGSTAAELNRFKNFLVNPERGQSYATLSEVASWLLRFDRLREELDGFRDMVDEVLGVIAGFRLSPYDAPQINQYSRSIKALREALNIHPEDMEPSHLEAIEQRATENLQLAREIHNKEASLMLRDRWLSRISIRMRRIHPNADLSFVGALFERRQDSGQGKGQGTGHNPGHGTGQSGGPNTGQKNGQDKAGGPAGGVRENKGFQTFPERVREVITIRRRLAEREVFMLAPNNTQKQLSLLLVKQLQRLKGISTPIFVDISGCESFADDLRSRVPPYRLIDLSGR